MTTIEVYRVPAGEEGRAHQERHALFCLGGCLPPDTLALETCRAARPNAPHDPWDRADTSYFLGEIDGAVVAHGRLMRGPTGLQSASTVRKHGLAVPSNLHECAEASRIALEFVYQGTPAGAAALTSLLGLHIFAAATTGFPDAFYTVRPGLLKVLMRLLPLEFAPPFNYGDEPDGPQTARPVPTWAVAGSYHEYAAAVEAFQPPAVAQQMFPQGFGWVDRSRVRPLAELADLLQSGPRRMTAHMAGWRKQYPTIRD